MSTHLTPYQVSVSFLQLCLVVFNVTVHSPSGEEPAGVTRNPFPTGEYGRLRVQR